jgi:hypothetical protein
MEAASCRNPQIDPASRTRIEDALRAGTRDALVRHAQAGRSVPIWRDGAVAWIAAAEALTQLDASEQKKA